MQMDMLSDAATKFNPMKPAAGFTFDDPLDADEPGDVLVPTTRRELTRLAMVAAETGARFQREGVAHDPMAWLLAPRRLFEGESAIEACLGRDACIRALLVHGLGLGMDADPEEVDDLTRFDEDEDEDEDGDVGVACGSGEPGAGGGGSFRPSQTGTFAVPRYSA